MGGRVAINPQILFLMLQEYDVFSNLVTKRNDSSLGWMEDFDAYMREDTPATTVDGERGITSTMRYGMVIGNYQ